MEAPALFCSAARRLSLLLFSCAAVGLRAQAPSAADGFNPSVGGTVYAVAVQADGKVLVGGNFSSLQPNGAAASTRRGNIARVNLDGTLDTTFDPEANGQVMAIAVQADGRVLIGGYFTSLQPNGGASVTRNHIARLNTDGSVDTTFDPNAQDVSANSSNSSTPTVDFGRVTAITALSNGQILIGGLFTTLTPNGGAVVGINRMARLNPNGSVDTSFNPNVNGQVNSIAVQPNGQIVIGGNFTQVNGNTSINYIARLNGTNGLPDTTFAPPALNDGISAVAIQLDGKILIGGTFTNLTIATSTTVSSNTGTTTPTTLNYLARLNSNGSQDMGYNPEPSAGVNSIVVQPDGKAVVGGAFVNVQPGGVSTFESNYVVRLNLDGTPDTTFNPNPNYIVDAIALQADGKVVLGGEFSQFLGTGAFLTQAPPGTAPSGTIRNAVARVGADGTLDTNFAPEVNGGIGAVAVQANGSIVIGGSFSSVGGVTRSNLARLSSAGALDTTFAPNPNGAVSAIAIEANGQIVVGGAFTTIQPNLVNAPVQANYITRLNSDGTQDSAFSTTGNNTGTNGQVEALAIEPTTGRIYVGGSFGVVNGQVCDDVARLNSDGSFDANFQPNPQGAVHAIVLEPSDNAVILGGDFSSVIPASTETFTGAAFLARVSATDGSADPNFLPSPNGEVDSLVRQPNGQILAGGEFTTVLPGGVPQPTTTVSGGVTTALSYSTTGVETITTTLPGGATTTTTVNLFTVRNRIARFNDDGSLDTTFDPNANSVVRAMALQSNGQILLGGYFTTLQPNGASSTKAAVSIARVNSNGALDTNFSPAANGVVNAIALQSNGSILLGGAFTGILPTNSSTLAFADHVTRLASNGTIDTTFALAGGTVGFQTNAVAVQPDGHVIVGGAFQNVAGFFATNIVRFNPDSTFDGNFIANANGPVNAIVVQPDGATLPNGTALSDGMVVVGGSFSAIGLGSAKNLARLTSSGALDTSFLPNPDGSVQAIAVQANGQILAGGAFANIAGGARSSLARLNTDGSLDTSFSPASLGASVTALALQSNGQIVVGTSGNLLRLNSNGSLDSSFAATSGVSVAVIAIQPDGRILVGGSSKGSAFLARFNSNGSADSSFAFTGTGSAISAIGLQVGGQIYVGGNFAGAIGITNLARLNANGTADTSFNPSASGPVTALALEEDGKLVTAGAFATIGGQARFGIARLAPTLVSAQSLALDSTRTIITWTRGNGPEFSAASFQVSTNDSTWTNVGSASRIGTTSNWQLTGASLPPASGGVIYIRANGAVPASSGGSAGLIQLTSEF